MFTLNSALHFIDTAGAHVVTVYQSASPLTVPLAGLPPERCEAYICAIKKNDLVQVYVALLTSSNKVLVYVDSRPPVRESALPGVLKEAITFAEGMGFQPEEMNLNYSAAMREVVVRGLKVFCPPKVVKKPVPRRGTAATVPLRGHEKIADVPPAKTEQQVKEESKPAPAAEKAPEPVRHGKPGDEAAALRMELVRLSAEMTAAENSARQVLVATKNELNEVRAEKEALALRVEEFTTAAEQAAEELAAAHGEAHALRTEKAALQRHMEEELATVRGELAALGQDKDAETKAGNRAMAALQEELARLRNEKASAAAKGEELTSLHQAAQKELEAIRVELADAVKKGENAGKRAAEEMASLRVELEKSVAAKSLAEGKAAELDELSRKGEARLTELETDLERL
ncbi:MAG TPA: hypothetical protein VI389_03625, partial [Geobacteraceae bacterium]